MSVYVYLDVSQKQEYIYKKNKLKDNLVRSFIVKATTEKLSDQHRDIEAIRTKLEGLLILETYLNDNYSGLFEFEYSGGGNSIIRFTCLEKAKEFLENYSYEILNYYPDLELYISIADEIADKEILHNYEASRIRELLISRSDQQKDSRKSRFKRWSYGIEEIDETGKAKLYGEETIETIYGNEIREFMLYDYKENLDEDRIKITTELNDYKKENGKSYIGVISIDGNRMGEIVEKIASFEDLRGFSKAINNIYFIAIIKALTEHASRKNNNQESTERLIVTPILQAGDDICIIVEAEQAVDIAASILKSINTLSQNNVALMNKYLDNKYLTACAGVAIVKHGYPYFEAIKIAEKLCYEAKSSLYRPRTEKEGLQRQTLISWEIVQSQVKERIKFDSYSKYQNYELEYNIKPLCIDQELGLEDGIISYDAFIKITRDIAVGNTEDATFDSDDNKISNSFLEGIKQHMYGGIEQYCLYLDINKKQTAKLEKIFENALNENIEYLLIDSEDNGRKKHTYLINDVIELLPFMKRGVE